MAQQKPSKLWGCLMTLVHIVLLPVYVTFFFLFLLVWGLLTVTGIGPLLQYCFTRRDRRTLDRAKMIENARPNVQMTTITVPSGVHSCMPDEPYSVFAIYMEPADKELARRYPRVCIPNGLGATATLISQMQEKLVQAGFRVLSFDRLGVGLSDANASKRSPTARDIVNEMHFVMNSFVSSSADTYAKESGERDGAVEEDNKWILLGPSMGSIIAQCYISAYPQHIVGFLNMDGLPYPFFKQHKAFMTAAWIYKVYASLVWTGMLRPFIGIALSSNKSMFECENFPLTVAIAQMNQSGFYFNVALEMKSMMDCCEMAEMAWGTQSILHIPTVHLESLIRAPPTVSIDFDDRTGERRQTTLRSESEQGEDWASKEDVERAVHFLQYPSVSNDTVAVTVKPESETVALNDVVVSQIVESSNTFADQLLKNDVLGKLNKRVYASCSLLGDIWSKLIVRVMSGRNHDFGNAMANSFYNQEMRDMAAAEHAVHVLLARDGARTNYPRLTHTVVFSKTDDIVRNIQEIGVTYLKLKQEQ